MIFYWRLLLIFSISQFILFFSFPKCLAQNINSKVFCSDFQVSKNLYLVNKSIDLNGDKLIIPKGMKIQFGLLGSFQNGVLVGNDTQVIAPPNNVIFKSDIKLEGTWKADIAHSDWFDFKDDCSLDEKGRYVNGSDNTSQLNNMLLFNKLLFTKGNYFFKASNFYVFSNTTIDGQGSVFKWINSSELSPFLVMGNAGKNIFQESSNILLKNFTVIGSKLESSVKTEQCHGIAIRMGSNIKLVNVHSNLNRGDGLYIGNIRIESNKDYSPSNIEVVNCVFDNNHRQGTSITRANGVRYSKCQFINTEGTAPQSGLDIEPNIVNVSDIDNNFYQCANISIDSCYFSGNRGNGLLIAAVQPIENDNYIIRKITLTNCVFDKGNIRAFGVENLLVQHCDIRTDNYAWLTYRFPVKNVHIDKCRFSCINPNSSIGIKIDVTPNNELLKNILISNCQLVNFNTSGISIDSKVNSNVSGFSIVHNQFYQCPVPVRIGKEVQGINQMFNSIEQE